MQSNKLNRKGYGLSKKLKRNPTALQELKIHPMMPTIRKINQHMGPFEILLSRF
jgi:hypothetical protein